VAGLLESAFEERLFERWAVALADSFIDTPGEKAVHRVGVGDWIAGEFIAEVVEGEFKTRADDAGVCDGFGEIVKEGMHLAGGAEVAEAVFAEEAAGFVNGGVVADGGEDVEEFAVFLFGAAYAIGGDDGQAQFGGEAEEGDVAGFLFALVMALEFDIQVASAVDGDEAIEVLGSGGFAFASEGGGEGSFFAAGEADESFREFFEIVAGSGTFCLGGFAHFEAGDELAEVLIAGLRFCEQDNARGLVGRLVGKMRGGREAAAEGRDGDFSTDVGFDFVVFGGGVEARDSVEAVAVSQRHGGHVDFECALDVGLGGGRGFEKAEGAGGVEFDVVFGGVGNDDVERWV